MAQPSSWSDAVTRLDFAFQPIVNAHTGACHGYEALLRDWEPAGFESIRDVFDSAYRDLALHKVDLALREKAIRMFTRLGHHQTAKLFYNVDGRVLSMPDYRPGLTRDILHRRGLDADAMCLEISEQHDVARSAHVLEVLNGYRSQSFGIAIDDFGTGYSGLKLLYSCHPDYIKIDRFFIEGISRDARKKLFVSNVVSMARLLGVSVIAEGIETADELRICRDIGCDFVQGFYIQRPTTNLGELLSFYPAVYPTTGRARRLPTRGDSAMRAQVRYLDPIQADAPMSEALGRFRDDSHATFLVAVNSRDEPVGLLREGSVKQFVFSPYGWALLGARSDELVADYCSACPTADINSSAENLIAMFVATEGSEEGVVLTDNGRYVGFIGASQILKLMSERDVAAAREQNPLTRLPGNHRISEYLREALADADADYAFVYYDFDGFKAFNDTYGFRRGDRAIQMFAQRLKLAARERPVFVGHVGGDDFFSGARLESLSRDELVAEVVELMAEFRQSVRSLYSPEDIASGGVRAYDRAGNLHLQPLLGVSAAVVFVPAGCERMNLDDLGSIIATLKVAAKTSPSHLMTLVCDVKPETREGGVTAALDAAPGRAASERL